MRVASLRRLTAPIAYVLVASQDPEERRILQRVLKRMMSRQVAAAFDTWMHNVHHNINERHGVVEQPLITLHKSRLKQPDGHATQEKIKPEVDDDNTHACSQDDQAGVKQLETKTGESDRIRFTESETPEDTIRAAMTRHAITIAHAKQSCIGWTFMLIFIICECTIITDSVPMQALSVRHVMQCHAY